LARCCLILFLEINGLTARDFSLRVRIEYLIKTECAPDQRRERTNTRQRMDAAEAAWRQLSVEATNVIDVLRRNSPSDKEPYSCVS